jgi:hypothetical protein
MTASIRIDDLSAPQLDETQRAAIAFASGLDLSFDPHALLARARERTGLTDFGSDDFVPRLAATTEAIEADTGLGSLGRLILHQRIVRLLANRLLVEDAVSRHPEILEVQLTAPIVVIGLPRSGTTHLVNLIAADARLRSLPYWESLEPVPGTGPDDRRARCEAAYRAQVQMAPHIVAMHHQYPDAIEEEIELEDIDFASYTLEWHARVPGWRDFYLALDQVPHYAYMKKVLQLLTWYHGPNRWVLKSPQHLEQIPALLAAFPDATFAVTHRDPVSVVRSAVTMLAYGDRMRRDHIDPDALVEYWADRIERLLRACVRDHALLPASRTVDVLFHEFMADDAAMVRRVYERAELPVTATARAAHGDYLATNPRGRYGQVSYDLAGDFGVDPARLRERFAFYFERFPVEVEAP